MAAGADEVEVRRPRSRRGAVGAASVMLEDDHRLVAPPRLALLLELRRSMEGRHHRWDVMDQGDVAAHRFLMGLLGEQRPGDAVLSEEGVDDRRRLQCDRVWIVDPLDGTNEYGEPGRPDWAVHVALWERGELTAGAVALPAMGVTFSTDPAPALPPVTRDRPRLVTSRYRAPYAAVAIAHALGCDAIRVGSAGAKAMMVVLGEGDIYVHDGGMYQWDSAAPAAVAAAAGLHVSRLDGSPLVYNQPDPWLPDFMVCRPELADDVLRALWG
ncbi:MAG: 3'(2'),5'-bisphosphate nucleotidase CysQ [Ilumatobacteraceae bacterium]